MNTVKFTRFSGPVPTVEELRDFYHVPREKIPNDRPYVWYMFVHSSDGKGSFKEQDHPQPIIGMSGPGIALSHLRGKHLIAAGSETDYRALQFLWASADAILGGRKIIDTEPDLIWQPTQPDLLEYRQDVLGKKKPPIQVVLTGRGLTKDVLGYKIFNSEDVQTIIATSQVGYDVMRGRGVDDLPVTVGVYGDERVDLHRLLKDLRSKYNVKFLDLQGGPRVAGQFLTGQMIDEERFTRAPGVVGPLNSKGEQRPGPYEGMGFSPDRMPLENLAALGNYGSHLFFRDLLNYDLLKQGGTQ